MTSNSGRGLLTSRDAGPVRITNRSGGSLFLLLGDHAGNLVPEQLGYLGLSPRDLERHIALDFGVSPLGQQLSAALDAPFIEQRYSRLVVDCNRATDHEGSIAEISDGTSIPGNLRLARSSAEQRIGELFWPYHVAIADLLAERTATARPVVLVSLHSFTPRLDGFVRPWEMGVLYSQGDTRFALAMLEALREESGLAVGDNEPYRLDETDFTVPHHAFDAKLPYVELEIRQDALIDNEGIIRIANILQKALTNAEDRSDIG